MPDLNHHNRYSFSPIIDRPDFSWQDGKRLAFYIGVNIEWFAFSEEGGAVLASSNPTPDIRTTPGATTVTELVFGGWSIYSTNSNYL